MLKLGVLVSGGGTNLQAVIDSIGYGYLNNVEIAVVISSNSAAYAIERAKMNDIPYKVIRKKDYEELREYDSAMIEELERHGAGLVILAGFKSVFGLDFVNRFKNRIMNIHPSLIPAFCGKGCYGLRVHEYVLERGVKITGATVHFVTEEIDAGPIILQKAVDVYDCDTPESLQQRVMEQAEWILYPEAIKLFSENKLSIENNKVRRISE